MNEIEQEQQAIQQEQEIEEMMMYSPPTPLVAPPPKEPDKPKAEPIRLTFERCSRVLGELDRKQCYIIGNGAQKGMYFQGENDWTEGPDMAVRHTPRQAINRWGVSITSLLIELIDQDLALDISTRKLPKCAIEQALRASLIELLKLAPLNPTARACIMRETTKMPPDSCKTYEELKAWIEENCERRLSPDGIRRAQLEAAPQVGVDFDAIVQAAERGVAFTVPLKFTDRQHGSATYYQRRESVDDYEVSHGLVTRTVNRAIAQGMGRIGDIASLLMRSIEEDAWNACAPEMESYGNASYEDDTCDGHDNKSVNPYSNAVFRENLRDYLRATLPPEQAELIEGL